MTATKFGSATAWARVDAIRAKLTAAEDRIAELEAVRDEAIARPRRAREQLRSYLADVEAGRRPADDRAEREVRAELEAAEAPLSMRENALYGGGTVMEPYADEAEARLDGALDALEQRHQELDTLMRSEHDALLAETASEARRVAGELTSAVAEALPLELELRRVRARWRRLGYRLPPSPVRGMFDGLAAGGSVEPPIPDELKETI